MELGWRLGLWRDERVPGGFIFSMKYVWNISEWVNQIGYTYCISMTTEKVMTVEIKGVLQH